MNKITITLLVAILLTSCSRSDPEQEAAKLFTEASDMYKSVSDREDISFSEEYDGYMEVFAKIDKIKTKYPNSEVAKNIDEKEIVNYLTVSDLKAYVYSLGKIKALAEGDPLSCALFMLYMTGEDDQLYILSSLLGSGSAGLDHYDQALIMVRTLSYNTQEPMLLGMIAKKFIESGQIARASQLIDEIFDPEIKKDVSNEMAVKYLELGKFKDALEIVRSIEDQYERNSMLSSIALKYAETGQDKQAFEVVDLIDLDSTRVSTLANIAAAYAEAGRKDKASETLTQVIKESQEIEDRLDRSNITVGIISNEAAVVSHYDTILALSKTMEDTATKCYILLSLAEEYFEIGQKDKALELLSKALESTKALKKDDADDVFINKEQFLSFIAFKLADFGEYERANEVVNSISTEEGLWSDPYADMAKTYVQLGQFGHAEEMIKRINGPYDEVDVLISLSDKYYEAKNVPEALKTLSRTFDAVDKLEEPSSGDMLLIDIATQYGKMGETAEAEKALSLALKSGKQDSYENTGLVYIATNEYANDELRRQVLEIAKTLSNEYRRRSILSDLAEEFTASKHYDIALDVSYAIEHPVTARSALMDLSAQYMKDGEKEKALETLSKAVKMVNKRAEAFGDRALALHRIAEEYIKIDQRDKALTLLDEAYATASKMEENPEHIFSKSDILERIADSYSQIGEYEKALEVDASIDDPYEKNEALIAIATSYAQTGKYKEALEIVGSIDEYDDKALVLIAISDSLSAAGKELDQEEKDLLHQITAEPGI